MGLAKAEEKNLFDEYGLEVSQGEVEVGQTYPIFGMITKILEDTPGKVIVELNYGIRARMNVPDQGKLDLLRERAFETGIFVSSVLAKDPGIEVDCKLVIFGRKQGFNA